VEKDWIGQTVPCPVCNQPFPIIIRVKSVSVAPTVQEWDPVKPEESVTGKNKLLITITAISVIVIVLLAAIGFTVVLPRLYIGNELSAAREARDSSDWDEVLEHAGNVLEKNPENPEARNYLVHCSETQDVPQDTKKAVKWYRKAAEQGYEEARKALRRLQK